MEGFASAFHILSHIKKLSLHVFFHVNIIYIFTFFLHILLKKSKNK